MAALAGCSDPTAPVAGVPAELVKVEGDAQQAVVGAELDQSLTVRVTDALGDPVEGAAVRWTVEAGSGSVPDSTVTDGTGLARAAWTLGTVAGEQSARAAIGTVVATFTASAAAGAASRLVLLAGEGQAGEVGASLPDSLAARVEDAHGNPVPGVTVTWGVTSGGGSVAPETSATGADGAARTGWTLGSIAGPSAASASIDEPEAEEPAVEFSATALAGPPAALVRLRGNAQSGFRGDRLPDSLVVGVEDVHGNALAHVEVWWEVTAGGGTVSPGVSRTGEDGRAAASWTLGEEQSANAASAIVSGTEPVTFSAWGWGTPRVVVFGDSNLEAGWSGRSTTILARSYIGSRQEGLNRGPDEPHHPTQLAGKIEAEWAARHDAAMSTVNHAVGGTNSGTGRHPGGSPHAREAVDGIERYRGEVLGAGYPWNGGESGVFFPDGPVERVRAFPPEPSDFVVIGMGTNDPNAGLTPLQTRDNIRWMIAQWKAAGLPAGHVILITLPPGASDANDYPERNDLLRALAADEGTALIDLVAYVSDDNGLTWRDPAFHLEGDPVHYAESVRQWLAEQVVLTMESTLLP
jgi:hypothetical protein